MEDQSATIPEGITSALGRTIELEMLSTNQALKRIADVSTHRHPEMVSCRGRSAPICLLSQNILMGAARPMPQSGSSAQPFLQKSSFRFLLGEAQGPFVGGAGFFRSSQSPAEIRSCRVGQVISFQVALARGSHRRDPGRLTDHLASLLATARLSSITGEGSA